MTYLFKPQKTVGYAKTLGKQRWGNTCLICDNTYFEIQRLNDSLDGCHLYEAGRTLQYEQLRKVPGNIFTICRESHPETLNHKTWDKLQIHEKIESLIMCADPEYRQSIAYQIEELQRRFL